VFAKVYFWLNTVTHWLYLIDIGFLECYNSIITKIGGSMARKKKAENKSEKKKLPLKRVVQNNLFMLKLIHKGAPFTILSMVLISVLEALTGFISGSYMLRFALNGINEGKSFSEIAGVLALSLIPIAVMMVVARWYWCRSYRMRMTRIKQYIFSRAYKKASEVDLSCYENPKYYDDLAKAIEECGNRAEAVNGSIEMLAYRIVNFSANFALLFAIDPLLLLFVLIPIAAVPIQKKINKVGYDKNMETTEENRRKDYSRRTFYLADYAKEMRLLDMPVFMLERFRASGERVVGIIKKYGFKMATLQYIMTECNEVIASLGAMAYAVWQTVGTGRMGFGDCLVVVNSIQNVAYSVTNSADTFLRFHDNALYIENLRKFFEYEEKIKGGDKPLPESGDIVLDGVSFKYDGASDYTLKNLSMRFGKNEKIAIVGHNGAGKSTLVKLLLRLYDAEGSITYGDEDIKDFDLTEYRDIFASVMQDFHIFSLSASENVLLRPMREGDEKTVAEAIEKSGLKEKIESFPRGVDTMMTKEFDKDGEVLSGGQAQKLAISYVYSRENRFVILDEPSSALDPIAEYEMYERMTEACNDCGMIFISHRLSSAVIADRIYLMENGEIIETGTHASLMEKNGRYAEMFRKQAQNYAEV